MARRRWSKIAAIATALVLVWAAPAWAYVETLPGAYSSFSLQGTHGYSIVISARPEEGSQEEGVRVFVGRKGSTADYEVPAKVTGKKIEARLGEVGRISVKFHPRGKPRIAHIKCNRSAELRYQPGVWRGRIEFNGEEGFTEVKARSAKEITWPLLLIACPYISEPEEEGAELPGARLEAWSKSHSIFLEAITNRPGVPVKTFAALSEQRGPLHVDRFVRGTYPGEGFAFDSNLDTATLSPAQAPFSGTALYNRSAEPQERWTGDLTIDFPGRSNVSLTGTSFQTTLAHARYTREKRYDE